MNRILLLWNQPTFEVEDATRTEPAKQVNSVTSDQCGGFNLKDSQIL